MTTRERVRELRADGLVYREIAERLGISLNHAKHCGVSETTYANQLRASRTAKQRRIGICESCGAETRYNGHGKGVSDICNPCSARATGEKQRNKGPVIEAVLALLATGDAVRFIELRDAVIAAGGAPLSINPLLYQRLIPHGIARRVARGLYVAGPALTNGKPT